MKTGTARYAKHYEIAAYGESAVRWGYNHWWSKAFALGFGSDLSNCARTTKADIACGWGLTEGSRSDIRYRNVTPKGLSQNKEARINPKTSFWPRTVLVKGQSPFVLLKTLSQTLILLAGLSLVPSPAWSAGTLKVTTPNGGQKWTTGKSYAVKWSKGNAGAKVKIQLLKSGKHYKGV